jgi:DNA-binding SARP family transcriptional activator
MLSLDTPIFRFWQAQAITIPGFSGLYVALLGAPVISWNGQPYSIRRQQVRAVLYYLAATSSPINRGQLCLLLWPDEPETTARRRLSRLLNELRHELPQRDLIVTIEDQVSVASKHVLSDVALFSQLTSTISPSDTMLERAIDLYRGSFLEGVDLMQHSEFDNWLIHERRIWEHRFLSALQELIARQVADGKHNIAIENMRHYLAFDELNENVHRLLIQQYALTGQRGAAIRQYRQCSEILRRELGVAPSLATQDTYTQLVNVTVRQMAEGRR